MTVTINDPFWSPRQALNRTQALLYQWAQYERCGTLENFRMLAENRSGKRTGYFYTDSDIHKWADAACRVLATQPDAKLEALLNEYIDLMAKAQASNGYLFTWNQIYFPNIRWKNLQVEHELYCAGHFIEAGVAQYQATGKDDLLKLVRKTADLIVRDFKHMTAAKTPGHQEIEIALIKLYRCTKDLRYLETAEAFLHQRGRHFLFALRSIRETLSHVMRSRRVKKIDQTTDNKELGFEFGENIQSREPRFLMLRALMSFWSGSYQQQHAPVMQQLEPKGHAVRWTYMMQATAMLAAEQKSTVYDNFQATCWQNMATKKMYITGGIGSLPVTEGFGRNYELNNEFSYSETCAAIGSIFWNNEMLRRTPKAPYADLIERQLYNAAAVGISQTGKQYFYRNPLESRGELERQDWFETACCPTNLSRLWADIGHFTVHHDIYIDQYIGCSLDLEGQRGQLHMASQLPWQGQVRLSGTATTPLKLHLRIPSWATKWQIHLNGATHAQGEQPHDVDLYTERLLQAHYQTVEMPEGSFELELNVPMEILTQRADQRVKGNRGKVALSRGPLIYCIESPTEIGPLTEPASLRFELDDQMFQEPIGVLRNDQDTLIPYFIWGNRGKQKMKIWLDDLSASSQA
jgi:DUF1680 family protein